MSIQLQPRAATGLVGEPERESPLVSFIDPRQLEIVAPSRRLKQNPRVEATDGLLGLDILLNSSLSSCCGYKSASLGWEALSPALAPGPFMWPSLKFLGLWCFSTESASAVSLYPRVITEYQTAPDNLRIQLCHVVKYL